MKTRSTDFYELCHRRDLDRSAWRHATVGALRQSGAGIARSHVPKFERHTHLQQLRPSGFSRNPDRAVSCGHEQPQPLVGERRLGESPRAQERRPPASKPELCSAISPAPLQAITNSIRRIGEPFPAISRPREPKPRSRMPRTAKVRLASIESAPSNMRSRCLLSRIVPQ